MTHPQDVSDLWESTFPGMGMAGIVTVSIDATPCTPSPKLPPHAALVHPDSVSDIRIGRWGIIWEFPQIRGPDK